MVQRTENTPPMSAVFERRIAMSPMKRLGWIVLAMTLGALFAASPALADKPLKPTVYSSTFKLAPPADGPEPEAYGQCTIDYYLLLRYEVEVSCRALTPGGQYTLVVLVQWTQIDDTGYPIGLGSYLEKQAVTADSRGRLSAQYLLECYEFGVYRSVQDVWIENSAGEVVLERP